MVEFILILGAAVIYFAPALVAAWVRHPKLAYIGGVNAALGVTVVGWAGALMWALRRRKVVAMSYHGDMQVARSFNVNLAATCALVVGVALVATIGVNRFLSHHNLQPGAPVYAVEAVSVQPQWRYSDVKGVRTASLASSNSPSVPAAYKGGPITLNLAQGADGTVVRLDADSELQCSYAPTASSLEISFDSGASQTFACAPAPAGARKLLFDGDHSTAYIANPSAFLARLKGVRHIAIVTSFAGVTEPQSLEYDIPADAPILSAPVTQAPVTQAKAATAVAVPAVAVATAAATAKAPAAGDDQATSDDHEHGRRHHHHHRADRHGNKTYVDGIPAKPHHHRSHHARG